MRTLRLWLTWPVVLALLGGLSGTVSAQQGQETADSAGGIDESFYEVTITQDLMPPELGKINLERHELIPGFEASIGIENEGLRGKSLYVAEGELRVTPMVDALVWRGDEAAGGNPEIAFADEEQALETGDVIYLPAVPADRLADDATTLIANPGETTTLLLGHHAHDSSIPDRFPGWPSGMSGTAVAVGSDLLDLERVMAGDAVYRLMRARFEPGEQVTLDEDAAMILVQVDSGTLGQLAVNPEREMSFEWPAGRGRQLKTSPREGVTYTWSVVGEEPLELLMLTVTPVASE